MDEGQSAAAQFYWDRIRPVVVCTRSRPDQYELAIQACCHYLFSVTLKSASTLTWPWVPTLQSSTPSFVSLTQISNVRRSLTQDALLTIIRAPVTMKLELLLLCTGWCVYIANATAIVCVEHHWSISILSEEIRAHHSSPREPHWLKVPERLQYLLCVLVHRCLHGTVPPYMAKSLHLTTHVDVGRGFRSASTSTHSILSTRGSRLGYRAFLVAATRAGNNLPPSVIYRTSLTAFGQQRMTVLFQVAYG